jgi:hypothetical protein
MLMAGTVAGRRRGLQAKSEAYKMGRARLAANRTKEAIKKVAAKPEQAA